MIKGKYVNLDLVKGSKMEYIIRDLSGITLGRIFIIQLDKENKYCLFRLKFYKNYGKTEFLVDTFELMLKVLFKNMNLNKVNILVEEDMNLEVLTSLGLELEGFLKDNIIGEFDESKSELLFGINSRNYENGLMNVGLCLEGENIELKVLTPENSEEVLNYCIRNKKHLGPYEPTRSEGYFTIESQRKYLIEGYKAYLNGKEVSFGIFKENILIGKIKISNIVMGIFKSCTVGYSMDEKEQGQGYMKAALNLISEYAFMDMDIHRIEASALVDNTKSKRVLKSCGFKELGINEKYLYINGKWRDHVTFYKTRNE